MRVDAHRGDLGWSVWHVGRCDLLKDVVWVDDEMNAYWRLEQPLRVVGDEVAGYLERARRIVILRDRRLVLIDPVEDVGNGDVIQEPAHAGWPFSEQPRA